MVDKGKIIEDGSFDELVVKENGRLKEVWKHKAGGVVFNIFRTYATLLTLVTRIHIRSTRIKLSSARIYAFVDWFYI